MKMNEIKITIVIPLYNFANYIEKCLNSLVNQTSQNFEVIIINDGSTDNSKKVVQDFISRNKLENFTLISQKNSGVSRARNVGIKVAKTDWIAFVDSDDYVSPDFISELEKNVNDADFVIGNYAILSEEGRFENKNFYDFNSRKFNKKNFIINLLNEEKAEALSEYRISSLRNVWSKLYNRKILLENKIEFNEDLCYFEDGLFNLMYVDKIKKVNITTNCIYNYFVTSAGSTTKKIKKNYYEDKIKINLVYDYIKKYNFSEIKTAFDLFRFDCLSSYLINGLFHPLNKISISYSIKTLKNIRAENIYGIFDYDLKKYLKFGKKIIFLLLKNKLYIIVCFLLKVRAIVKR